jgi:hypothetical protein
MSITCHHCGTPLGHIDDPCPNCLPNFGVKYPFTRPQSTQEKDALIASLRAENERLTAEWDEAQSLADWYHRTNNEGIEAIWAVLGHEPYREGGENLLGRVTELKARAEAAEARADKAAEDMRERCAKILDEREAAELVVGERHKCAGRHYKAREAYHVARIAGQDAAALRTLPTESQDA